MAEQIEARALVEAVAAFLAGIEADLTGQKAFHAKVAGNALAIVTRELAQQPQRAEAAALAGFLGVDAPLDRLRADICERLRSGELSCDTPGLLDALTTATLAKVATDNPRYSTFRRLNGEVT